MVRPAKLVGPSRIAFALALILAAPALVSPQHGGGGGHGGHLGGAHFGGGHFGSHSGGHSPGHFLGRMLGRHGSDTREGRAVFVAEPRDVPTAFPEPQRFSPRFPFHRRFRHFDNFFGGCFDAFSPNTCGFGTGLFWLDAWPFWGEGDGWEAPCDPALGCDDNADVGIAPAETETDNSEPSGVLQPVILVLKDGSSYGVTSYWLAGGNLQYLTTYGGRNSISLDRLDWQRTVDENAARGLPFTLKPQP